MPNPRCISIAIGVLLTGASSLSFAQAVHSAAGALPGDRVSATSYVAPTSNVRSFSSDRQRSAPPLPTAATQGARVSPANSLPAAQPSPQPSPRFSAPPTLSFEDALEEGVTIDVVDMALSDFLEALTPSGWRMRFQHVSDSVKEMRIDFTAQGVSRRDVLHDILGDAQLTVQPFDGFDTPLLLITSDD